MLTELVHREDGTFASTVVASHFCQAYSTESLRPSEFVRSIVMQLLEKLEMYKMTVEASESLQSKVKAIITGEHRAGSTDKDEMEKDPLESFIKCVLEPLGTAYPNSETPVGGHIIVIDSLDEALLASNTPEAASQSIVDILKIVHAKHLLPPWLKILASSRHLEEVTQMRAWHTISLDDQTRT